ncbi:hypothetical protein DLAC_00634 [Tieghemostelium lacteum]|uniref:Uncharacterized protein n=1 Tax=Tieghemostelium lacteum TaxID=361077 RepID=A0A152AAH3_TIELA|nr:hypothetical protein DLAC_00634 [Tieghemostelium lacteum]|eukprot:KYR03135.1 hypothetical protein DLAC_00634 [Tieghemostelium lacteum]
MNAKQLQKLNEIDQYNSKIFEIEFQIEMLENEFNQLKCQVEKLSIPKENIDDLKSQLVKKVFQNENEVKMKINDKEDQIQMTKQHIELLSNLTGYTIVSSKHAYLFDNVESFKYSGICYNVQFQLSFLYKSTDIVDNLLIIVTTKKYEKQFQNLCKQASFSSDLATSLDTFRNISKNLQKRDIFFDCLKSGWNNYNSLQTNYSLSISDDNNSISIFNNSNQKCIFTLKWTINQIDNSNDLNISFCPNTLSILHIQSIHTIIKSDLITSTLESDIISNSNSFLELFTKITINKQ